MATNETTKETNENTNTETTTNNNSSIRDREQTPFPVTTTTTNNLNIPPEQLQAALTAYFKNNPPSLPDNSNHFTIKNNHNCNQTEPPRKKRKGNSLTALFAQQPTNSKTKTSKPKKRKQRRNKSKSKKSIAPSSNSV